MQDLIQQRTCIIFFLKTDEKNDDAQPNSLRAPDFFQIGSREIFDESHDMYRETVRKFFQDEVVPHHDKWEEAGEVPRDLWLAAGETGMLGVPTPEEYGGMGVDILYSAIVWEEQAYTGCTGPGFALHSDIVCPYLVNYCSEEQKQKYLPKLCSGEYVMFENITRKLERGLDRDVNSDT